MIVMADKIVSTGTWHALSPFGIRRCGTNVYVYSTHKDYKDKDQMPLSTRPEFRFGPD